MGETNSQWANIVLNPVGSWWIPSDVHDGRPGDSNGLSHCVTKCGKHPLWLSNRHLSCLQGSKNPYFPHFSLVYNPRSQPFHSISGSSWGAAVPGSAPSSRATLTALLGAKLQVGWEIGCDLMVA